jgi:hypothetical protein
MQNPQGKIKFSLEEIAYIGILKSQHLNLPVFHNTGTAIGFL